MGAPHLALSPDGSAAVRANAMRLIGTVLLAYRGLLTSPMLGGA